MKKDKRKEPGAPGRVIDFTNFHECTRAEFTPARPPDREPDFVSPSGSVYWDLAAIGVVRSSDHWAGLNGCTGQASCVWSILDAVRPGVWISGYCAYENFKPRVWVPRRFQVDARSREIAQGIAAGNGVYAEHGHVPKAVPFWAKVNFRGSAHMSARAQQAFSSDPNLSRVITADAHIIQSILDGQDEVEFGRILY